MASSKKTKRSLWFVLTNFSPLPVLIRTVGCSFQMNEVFLDVVPAALIYSVLKVKTFWA